MTPVDGSRGPGAPLEGGDIDYLRVGDTDGPVDEKTAAAHFREYDLFKVTQDVTNDWISGAPGAATPAPAAGDPVDVAVALCRRFDVVSRQLRRRHQNRPTLEDCTDSYDVQDLMHALLLVHFSDVRAESWNPTYLGSGSRTDFLVPEGDFILEVWKTRPTLLDRQVGSELAEDVTRYSDPAANRGASTLICFVHDPDISSSIQ